jgi:glycosyltransferase involved in cell wall biosynthesis
VISVLIPVLGRPQNAQAVCDSIHEATSFDHEIIFVVSRSDEEELEAVCATGEDHLIVSWPPGPGDFARKTNVGFAEAAMEWVFLGADDLRFHPGWDEEALSLADETGAKVIGTQDLCNPLVKRGRHSTHSLVHAAYIAEFGGTFDEQPGVVYAECYDHQSVDNELLVVAQDRGVWAFADDAIVEHMHPLARKANTDATYRKGMALGREDNRLFMQRRIGWERSRKRRRPARA